LEFLECVVLRCVRGSQSIINQSKNQSVCVKSKRANLEQLGHVCRVEVGLVFVRLLEDLLVGDVGVLRLLLSLNRLLGQL
jgi:hypothetical protein